MNGRGDEKRRDLSMIPRTRYMDLAAAMALAASLWVTLPHGDTAWDLLETVAPFMFTEPMNTGGTLSGLPLHLGSEASSWTQASFRLGLADVTDAAPGGRPLIYPDLSMLESVNVRAAGVESHAGAPGPVLTLVPKAGGSTWLRTVAVAGSPSGLQAKGYATVPPVARLNSLARMELSLGGPLTPSAGLFAAVAGVRSSHVERAESFALPGDVLSFMAHPTFALSSGRHADVTAWLQRTNTAFAARALLLGRDVRATQSYGGVAGTWAGGVKRMFEVSGAFGTTTIAPDVAASAPRGTIERLVDDPLEFLVNESGGTHQRRSIAARMTTGSRVILRSGASASNTSMDASPFGTGLIGETIDGVAVRAWDYGLTGVSHRSESTFGAHVSAETHLASSVTMDAGIRLEHVSGSARGATDSISWTSLEPRVSLHYARGPWGGELTARRYHPRLPLTVLSAGDPAGPSGRSFLWTDRNGDGLAEANELGALVSLAGPGSPTPGFSTIDPALKRPYVDELLAAIDLRMSSWASLRFSGVSRRGAALLGRYDVGVPADAYTVHMIFDPGLNLGGPEDDQMLPIYSRPVSTFGADRYLLTNVPSVNSTYGGLYVAVLFEKSPRWQVLAAASALHSYAPAAFRGYAPSENDEMVIGDSYSDPNSNTYSEGRTLFDRGYGLKVTGTYHARARTTLSLVARYADGQNFARLVIAPDLPQGTDLVRAYANGKSKFTFTATLDVRAQKIVTLSGHDVSFAIEGYNLTNLHNEVEEVTISGADWRKPTFAQPPRVIRLSAGLSF